MIPKADRAVWTRGFRHSLPGCSVPCLPRSSGQLQNISGEIIVFSLPSSWPNCRSRFLLKNVGSFKEMYLAYIDLLLEINP